MASLDWLATISGLERAAALRYLHAEGHVTPAALSALAEAALTCVETNVDLAQQWLAIGEMIQAELVPDTTPTAETPPDETPAEPAVEHTAAAAQLAYAQARLAVHQGQLAEAEAQLRHAQAAWRRLNDEAGGTRILLGLTQVLAMQGRYDEAESAARNAVALLTSTAGGADFARLLQVAGAHHNLATLFVYTERHGAALASYDQAAALLQRIAPLTLNATEQQQLTVELAHNELNRASALTFLDQPEAAERALQQASTYFTRVDDLPNRGRAQTNLGRLYLRTGRYAAALAAFDQATTDLLGTNGDGTTIPLEQLRQADELFLEQALAFLVMNLLPEAEQALARSEALFRSAEQPYELGQTLYTWGILRLRTTEWAVAQPLLAEAATRFATLQNQFWLNRTHLAQAALAYRRGDYQGTNALLSTLIAATADAEWVENAAPEEPAALVTWDLAGLIELHLLRLRLSIDEGSLARAESDAVALAGLLKLDLPELRSLIIASPTVPAAQATQVTGPLPHYALRFHHLLGRLADRTGDFAMAQAHLQHALSILEEQRATLPIEEIRTAFLDDKTEIYSDLVQLLLERADEDPTLIAAAFATVERARSRTLLERLLAATSGDMSGRATATGQSLGAQPAEVQGDADVSDVGASDSGSQSAPDPQEELRQRLHWLYNQLLGESGSRNLSSRLSEQILMEEAALQRLEWRRSPLLQQAEPVDLQTFQAALAEDQQAIVYTILGSGENPGGGISGHGTEEPDLFGSGTQLPTASVQGAEVMAFLIDRHSIQVFRRLTDTTQLQPALDELRFQLGRAELGKAYLARHQERLRIRLQAGLARLYQLLLAPLRPALTAGRLLIVPAGPLHQLPFHALWDGASYLVATYECSYAPSASVVVMRRKQSTNCPPIHSWAGLAVNDAAIPAARMEVTGAARYFTHAHLYLDEAAGRQGLAQAAQASVLHLATHGLFRPDNPFFSALKLADGWIDVREIYRLPLQARLVILSACESGASQISGGDEVVGLARGFLGAGAHEVLASLWNVHDESAVILMEHFYHHLTYETAERPAAALRSAQMAALTEDQHPYYWAPFFVIGD